MFLNCDRNRYIVKGFVVVREEWNYALRIACSVVRFECDK